MGGAGVAKYVPSPAPAPATSIDRSSSYGSLPFPAPPHAPARLRFYTKDGCPLCTGQLEKVKVRGIHTHLGWHT